MSVLVEIEELTKKYSIDYATLTEYVGDLNVELEALKRTRIKRLKILVQRAVESRETLKAGINANREIFKSPKTHVFHGIKVGLQKAKGKLDWEDDDKVVELIEKKFEDIADTLIITKKKPNSKALEELDVKELKSIGVSTVEGSDYAYIKPVDSNVDKLVKALLKENDDGEDDDG